MSEEVNTATSALTVVPAGGALVVGDKTYRLVPLAQPQPETAQDDAMALSIHDILRILNQHKWSVLLVVFLACIAGIVYTLMGTPTYRSTVVLQFDKAAQRVAPFADVSVEEQVYVDEHMFLQTQYGMLRSRALAQRVATELGLLSTDRTPSISTSFGKLTPFISVPVTAPAVRKSVAPQDQGFLDRLLSTYKTISQPRLRSPEQMNESSAVDAVLGSITVDPGKNTRLVKLQVVHTDPDMAARIANVTADTFINMAVERRLDATTYAKTYLQEQIGQTKARLEESERRLNLYARNNRILSLDEKTDVVNQNYTDFAAALTKAEQDRIKFEAMYQEVRNDPNKIPATLDSKMVQSYKEQKAKLEIEYQQNLTVYKPEFPKMVQLRAQMAEMDKQLRDEITAYGTAIRAQYEAALKHEALLRARVAATRDNVLSTQATSIDLNLLKREVDTNRQLYDSLLQRIKQLGVSSGVALNYVAVLDRAEPSVLPFQPSIQKNVGIAAILGLILAAAFVAVRELWDDSIKTAKDVEALSLAMLGLIPEVDRTGVRGGVGMACHHEPTCPVAEAYRSTRAAVDFSTADGAPRRVMVTSTLRNEGKSTTALGLAINFAQLGHRTLLIDADLRNPSVHKLMGIENSFGLCNLLVGDHSEDVLSRRTEVPNLAVITAGTLPPNPVELLSSPKLLLLLDTLASMGFDRIVVDAPPMLGLADSIVLGKQVKNILFVIESGRTRRSGVIDALRRLEVAGLRARGAIITQAAPRSMPAGYESYYAYGAVESQSRFGLLGTGKT